MVQQSSETQGMVARCPSCGTSTPITAVGIGQYLDAHGQVMKYCPECGSPFDPSTREPSGARPAHLGLYLTATIAAYALLMGYAFSQYTFGSVYEGGTPKSITHTGQVAAQIATLLSVLGFGLSFWGAVRANGSRRGWYIFAAVGAFLSFSLASALAEATF